MHSLEKQRLTVSDASNLHSLRAERPGQPLDSSPTVRSLVQLVSHNSQSCMKSFTTWGVIFHEKIAPFQPLSAIRWAMSIYNVSWPFKQHCTSRKQHKIEEIPVRWSRACLGHYSLLILNRTRIYNACYLAHCLPSIFILLNSFFLTSLVKSRRFVQMFKVIWTLF